MSDSRLLNNKYGRNISGLPNGEKISLGKPGKPLVIWFNHWFQAIVDTINDIYATFDNIEIIASNTRHGCVYQSFVDEFFVEPDIDGIDYVNYALKICRDYNVDVFIPKKHSSDIADNIGYFDDIGVKVLCEKASVIHAFDSKVHAYNTLRQYGYDKIPYYKLITSVKDFKAGYKEVVSNGRIPCIKYDSDEGAQSFRVIADGWQKASSLNEMLMNLVTPYDMHKILEDMESSGTFKPLIMMEKLSNPEVSVDCYNSPTSGFLAIPRFKMGGRVKEIRLDTHILDDCKRLLEIFKFKSAFNVQYRWQDDKPYLLEVNPRISGGTQISNLSGVHIPIQMLSDAVGAGIIQKEENVREIRVSEYETPVEI